MPHPLFAAPQDSHRVGQVYLCPPSDVYRMHHYGSYFHGTNMVSGLLADISSKVCQGEISPKGYSRFLRITIAFLSQTPRLGGLLPPHGVFQGTFLTARDGPRR